MQAYLEALLPLVVATCTLTPLNAVDLAVDEGEFGENHVGRTFVESRCWSTACGI
jgi:hypothetical protein